MAGTVHRYWFMKYDELDADIYQYMGWKCRQTKSFDVCAVLIGTVAYFLDAGIRLPAVKAGCIVVLVIFFWPEEDLTTLWVKPSFMG